jgi:hypothetical protein
VPAAVHADVTLTERQKQVLLEIYDSFRRENDESPASAATADDAVAPIVIPDAGA